MLAIQLCEVHTCLAVIFQNAKVMIMVYKCLLMMEKALSLWVEDMNRKRVLNNGNGLCHSDCAYTKTSQGIP